MDFDFWAPRSEPDGGLRTEGRVFDLVPPGSPAIPEPDGMGMESEADVALAFQTYRQNEGAGRADLTRDPVVPVWQQIQQDAFAHDEVIPLGPSDFGIPYSPQSGPAGGVLGGGATLEIPLGEDFQVNAQGIGDVFDPLLEFAGEAIGGIGAGRIASGLPLPWWMKVGVAAAGSLIGGQVQEGLGLDPSNVGPSGVTDNPSFGGSEVTQMTRIPTDFPGPVDIGGRAIEQLPGGAAPGLGRLRRGITGATGGTVAKAKPVAGMPGAWQGSYWPNPFSKRKRGFFVYPNGLLRTWSYKRHIVVSSNPRAKTLARAAQRIGKLTGGLVKADRAVDRATKKLRKKRK